MRMKKDLHFAKREEVLRFFMLGSFQIKWGQTEIFQESIVANKEWELFLFLLTNRGKSVHVDTILETLWPNADYSDPQSALRMQMHRIRKFFDTQLPEWEQYFNIASHRGYYRLDVSASCWIDVEEFELGSQEARRTSLSDIDMAIKQYERVIGIYRGGYLQEKSLSLWVLNLRHYYRNLYLKTVYELIDLLHAAKQSDRIIAVCEEVFLLEPFEDILNIIYMRILVSEGKIQKAFNHYEHITSLMYHKLGIAPSIAMKDLYRFLVAYKEPVKLDKDKVQELLLSEEMDLGPMLCPSETFRQIYILERRRMERSGKSVQVISLTLAFPEDYAPESLEKGMVLLKDVITSGLRKGDVVSRWHDTQFVILLSDLDQGLAEDVVSRLSRDYAVRSTEEALRLIGSIHKRWPE